MNHELRRFGEVVVDPRDVRAISFRGDRGLIYVGRHGLIHTDRASAERLAEHLGCSQSDQPDSRSASVMSTSGCVEPPDWQSISLVVSLCATAPVRTAFYDSQS